MMRYIRQRLSIKLFLSYLFIILVGAGVMILTAEMALPRSFERHMSTMMAGEVEATGQGQGRGMGPMMGGNPNAAGVLFSNFRAGFTEAMLIAIVAAVVFALIVSLVFSRRLVAPIDAMMIASERIAAGRYDERVNHTGTDELGQLAMRFNDMAEQLEQVEAMRRRLIGDVSHELRTPLTAIKGSMEGLVDGVIPATSETFEQLAQEAERLSRLVDDLQEISRVESRAYQLNIGPQDAVSLAQTVVKRLGRQAEIKNIHLALELPSDLPHVLADSDRLTQVLTNLIGNALQYTPEDGTVTLYARPDGPMVQFSIKDTGIGIPPAQLQLVFDRFYRVDKSRSRRSGGGSGIGLTIARHFVEAQGGKIWVESAGEGQGSTFLFTLPTAES